MKRIAISVLMLASACAQPAPPAAGTNPRAGQPFLEAPALPLADGAGNRMEELAQRDDGGFCTADGAWCVRLGAPAQVTHEDATTALPAFAEEAYEREVWDVIIRIAGDASALIGIEEQTHQMYSGGDAGARHVTLYEVSNGGAREILTLPTSGAADIRACFSEDDERQRAGACRDMYSFVSRVSLDQNNANGAPRIVLETAAGSYPGRVTRSADSLEQAPLQPSDLIWAADETCSYRRVATRAGDAYVWDQPLPACADYLEP